MGLGLGGLQSGGSAPTAASVLPALIGQDIVARSISLTQVSGSVAVSLLDGARLNFSTADASAYITRSAANVLQTPGTFQAITALLLGSVSGAFSMQGFYSGSAAIEFMTVGQASTFVGTLQMKGMAESGGAETGVVIGCKAALAVTQDLVQVRNGPNFSSTKAFALGSTGKLQSPGTDSTGTPGAATIDKPCGRSSIAAGAATVTITNALVTAASLVFISPLARDATGLDPAVTTTGAGSFAVTTAANCTANLPFNWIVIQPL